MKIDTWKPILPYREKVEQKISAFWDKFSPPWLSIWGPHIHHGFYEKEKLTPIQAQEALIEKLAQLLQLKSPCNLLDVGCGMGGTSIYLAKKYHVNVTGITISPKQIEMAKSQLEKQAINSVTFKLENALSMQSLTAESFDIVWSLESCEQFYDKKLFLEKANLVLKPNGILMLATWCSEADSYEGYNAKIYQRLCHAFDLPYMPSMHFYHQLLSENNFKIIKTFDWTNQVAKSWDIGLSLINTHSLFQLFKMGGWQGLKFLKQIKVMQDAFQRKSIRYGVFYAKKMSVREST